jgi:hypothetical protein
MNAISALPTTSSPPPGLPSGSVRLYRDNRWDSDVLELTTQAYRDGVRHSFAGTTMQDAATWVAFNLPVGVVMTLMDNDVPVKTGKGVADLSGCGRCIDLVGTGQTQAVDLVAVNLNDCVSAFFWREVDLRMGAVELYDDADFKGNRSVIFLAEWPSATVNSIGDWWINDRVSAVRWGALDDRQMMVLYENADGSGRSFENVHGWGGIQEAGKLGDSNFNDAMSSFRWDGVPPVKEIVYPFSLETTLNMEGATGFSVVKDYSNSSDLEQSFQIELTKQDAQTVTVTSTDTQVVETGIAVETSVGYSGGGVSAAVKMTVSLKFSYTHSQTNTNSVTTTIGFRETDTIKVPPKSFLTASITAQVGTMAAARLTTTADRWYVEPVSGGVADPENHGWYKRNEPVTGEISAGIVGKTTTSVSVPQTLPQ